MNQTVRVVVTGAAGQIGYALLFRIASGQMFGPQTPVELNLLELPQSMPMLEGVAMELDDCAFPLLKRIVCTSELKTAMDGVNWALLVGSSPRKQGMERSDLLQINGGIFSQQGQALNDWAAKDVRAFVVGNPCNTNCLIAMNHATAVTQMTIWGNHSSTQYPDFEHAKINGISAAQVIHDQQWLQETFVATVQQRGAAILKARGASSAASAANAVIHGVNSLLLDTSAEESYSMCLKSEGQYGVDDDLIFSFPCRTVNGKRQVVEGISLSAFAQAKFDATLNELRQERDAVRALGLID